MKYVLTILALVCLGVNSNAQDGIDEKVEYVVVYGIDKPDAGFPIKGKVEEGTLVNGRKHGVWTKYHKDGESVRLRGTYYHGRPFGAYTKYWPNGAIKENGTYEAGKQNGLFQTFYRSGCLRSEKQFGDDGILIMASVFYYDDCAPPMNMGSVEMKFDGDSIYMQHGIAFVPAKLREETSGCGINKVTDCGANFNPRHTDVSILSGCIWGSNSDNPDRKVYYHDSETNKTPVLPYAYETDAADLRENERAKIYNEDDELWMDGTFQAQRLWDGKHYVYDSDGILDRIEIWNSGEFSHCGQL